MNFSGLKGKGLFVYSDPGGAKPVLALAESMKDKLTAIKIVSDRNYDFSSNFSIAVARPGVSPTHDIKAFQPDFVFTGTSYTSSIEHEYVKAARSLSIPSFAFVDHWTSIRTRFSWEGVEIFPDKILV